MVFNVIVNASPYQLLTKTVVNQSTGIQNAMLLLMVNSVGIIWIIIVHANLRAINLQCHCECGNAFAWNNLQCHLKC